MMLSQPHTPPLGHAETPRVGHKMSGALHFVAPIFYSDLAAGQSEDRDIDLRPATSEM
jgi:hypothetical protein